MKSLHLTFRSSLLILVLLVLILVYYSLDPANYSLFPKCPFYWITGYKCPGCGSQRAIHHLLNLEFTEAFKSNPLMVIAIPYIIGGFLFDYTRLADLYPRIRKILYGKTAIIIDAIIVFAWWILRNL
ncbi:MAG: DUF2752 domain-containing protein [Bacteroidetes bacterium]|nr:DUF2752 domain-containing protein [Bacteroidota bacterium]